MGIETPDEASLQLTKKFQNNRSPLLESIDRVTRSGLRVIAGFIIGFDGEQAGAGGRIVAFAEAAAIPTTTFAMLQALPHTALWHRLEQEGRLMAKDGNINQTTLMNFIPTRPVEAIAQRHGVRAVPVDLNDFRHELDLLKELRQGSCVGLVSISPGILRAAEVILHSMRGNELLVMTANPDTGSRLLALLRAASHVLCDRPSLPLVEQTLRQNRSQLMRLPVVHCAQSYLGTATIDQLRKEIGLLAG
jgi:hypothetical protein